MYIFFLVALALVTSLLSLCAVVTLHCVLCSAHKHLCSSTAGTADLLIPRSLVLFSSFACVCLVLPLAS